MKDKMRFMFKHTMSLNLVGAAKRCSFLMLAFLLSTTLMWGQSSNITVTGVVFDDLGDPLIGASVSQKGTVNGTMTDIDGKYSVTLPSNATLEVTFIGFHTQSVAVNGKTTIDIHLVENSKILDEVVVTALGIKKEAKALGYAIAEVKGDEITKGRDGNAITALSGRMAGVDISSGAGGPMGSTSVVIRGNSQLTGSNQPLYVVDGVPMDNSVLGSAGSGGGYDLGDGVASINPDDIESVSVLKGASASALYGSRASNGVILITTKSGKGQQGLGIDFSTSVNAVTIAKGFNDYQRVYGQGSNGQPPYAVNNVENTQSAWGGKLDPNLDTYIYNGSKRDYGNKNNNILDFFRTGVTLTNNLALSSSSDKANFRASVSDMRNNDIVPQADMYRTTIMLTGGGKLSDQIEVEGRANYTKEGVNNRPALSDSPNNIGNALLGIAPNFDQSWLNENFKDDQGRYQKWNGNPYRLNPYWALNEMSNKSNKDRMMGHMQISYKILPFLTARAKVGTDWSRFKFTSFTGMHTPLLESGAMEVSNINIQETNYEGIITYNQRFFSDVLDVTAFVGGNIMQYRNELDRNSDTGQNIPGLQSIINYSQNQFSVHDLKKQVNSVFGSVSLGYKNFLYLDLTVRHDISSTLSKENNAYTYPSVSGSFLFNEVINLKDYGLSFGKVRASWAKVGGDTDPYKLYNSYNLMAFSFGGLPLGQLASTNEMPNYNLKPTSTYSYELGFDLRFLDDRVGIDFGYYNQNTKDQIMNLTISEPSGYTSAFINAGEITQKGIEIALYGSPIRSKNFDWDVNFNLAKMSNNIKNLYEDMQFYELSKATWADAAVGAYVGQNYGAIMGHKLLRNDEGSLILTEHGMPQRESSLSVLGNGNHDLTMGFNNSFRYKDFRLGVLLDMKFGADVFAMSSRTAHMSGTSKNTLEGREAWYASEEARRAAGKTSAEWTPTGGLVPEGVVVKKDANGDPMKDANGKTVYETSTKIVNPQDYWTSISNSPEPYIFDASYIKLRELSFSYDLPKKVLAKTPLRAVTLSAFGRNLWIIHSKLKNIDPESSYNMSNGQGLEYGSLPTRRTFGFGVNVKF